MAMMSGHSLDQRGHPGRRDVPPEAFALALFATVAYNRQAGEVWPGRIGVLSQPPGAKQFPLPLLFPLPDEEAHP